MTASPLPADPQRIAVVGDWHGSLPVALAQTTRAADAGAEVFIHLGDFGLWVDDPSTRKYLLRLTRRLEQFDLNLFFVDGNHEDHGRLNALPIDPENGLRKVSDRIWHLPRGFRWTWSGNVWLALGGAHSVDRRWRIEGKSWWSGEYLTEAEVEYASRPGRVAVMITHDAPDRVDIPAIRGPSDWPQDDLVLAHRHRQMIGSVVRSARPSVLWHGHYHCRYEADLDLGWAEDRPELTGACPVHGLADDSAPWRGQPRTRRRGRRAAAVAGRRSRSAGDLARQLI